MDISPFARDLLIAMGVSALLVAAVALTMLWWLYDKLRRLRIDKDAPLGETLRRVPLLLVVALDLLDMSLNIFSAPFAWGFLHHMGWRKLRNLATAAAVIPGTQLLPVLTVSWIIARVLGKRADKALEAAQSHRSHGKG